MKGAVALRLKSKKKKITNQEGNIPMPQYL
jgi:hypothetical protein